MSIQDSKSLAPFLLGTLCGITCAFIWAGWILITSSGAKSHTLTIYDITFLRFSLVGLIFLPVVLKKGVNIGKKSWLGILIMSLGAGPIYILLAANGMSCTNIYHVGGLLPGTMPLFTALLSFLFLKERLSPKRIFGLFLIICAAFTLTGFNPFALGGSFVNNCLSLLVASLLWSGFTVAVRYWKVNPIHGAALVSVVSGCLYAPIYLIFLNPENLLHASLADVGLQLFYQGIMAATIGLILYSKAIELLGASRGAVFVALVPAIATLMGIPFLGDWPTLIQWFAIIILTIGVLLATGAQLSLKKRVSTS